ncbi:MAG TPA: hypothetical protein PK883_00460 [Anaerolineaceae bacterium]|nr:hypothetical protein [Anaerolineaceae bacterium]
MPIKIASLAELAAAPAAGDLLVIVDISEPLEANKTKKIQTQNLFGGLITTLTTHTNQIAALQGPPRVRLTVTTDFASSTTIANISWETEVFDTDTMFSSANPARVTFTTAGLYFVSLQVVFSSGTELSYRHAGMYLNGNTGSLIAGMTLPAITSTVIPINVGTIYPFTAGQYLTAKVQSGEAENIADCMFSAVRISD